jgi:hypothetical protein
MDPRPEKPLSFWEKYQRFSQKYYAPYVAWSFRLMPNLIAAAIALCGLGLFYLLSQP